MAILDFQRPDKVIMLSEDAHHGVFQFRPLERGYGQTIGNSLRRILLSSLEGFAITSVKIDGVDHEFATIPGVREDVTQIILNLKQVRFKAEGELPSENVSVTVSGEEQFKAGMIGQFLTGFTVLNPDLVICNMNADVNLKLDLTLRKGRGYVTADDNTSEHDTFGVLAMDSIHTPIVNVMYKVENYRVEQKTDYEMLTLDVTTDGSILPHDALKEAAEILVYHFRLFTDETTMVPEAQHEDVGEMDKDTLLMAQLLKTDLDELNLSVRALNCLKAANVLTLGVLVSHKRTDLLKIRNFGVKSLKEIETVVSKMGLTLGMDVSRYNIE